MKKVLIVEDGDEVRELLQLVFRLSGYKKIFSAENGEKGIDLAKKTKPDLIVMDVKMPGKYDGIKATKVVKSDPELQKCKIAMLSANCQRKDIEMGFNAGADAYFFKPFSPVEFMNGIENLLRKGKVRVKKVKGESKGNTTVRFRRFGTGNNSLNAASAAV